MYRTPRSHGETRPPAMPHDTTSYTRSISSRSRARFARISSVRGPGGLVVATEFRGVAFPLLGVLVVLGVARHIVSAEVELLCAGAPGALLAAALVPSFDKMCQNSLRSGCVSTPNINDRYNLISCISWITTSTWPRLKPTQDSKSTSSTTN